MSRPVDTCAATPVWLGGLYARLQMAGLPVLKSSRSGLFSISLDIPMPQMSAPPDGVDEWCFVRQPAREHAVMGVGRAASIQASGASRFSDLRTAYQYLRANCTHVVHGQAQLGAKAFMGFQFDPQAPQSAAWAGFENAEIVVPRLLLEWRGGRCTATFSCNRDEQEPPRVVLKRWFDDIDRVLTADPSATAAPAMLAGIAEQPSASAWRQGVERALRAIADGQLRKVVLARRIDLDFAQPVQPQALLPGLAQQYPGCRIISVGRRGKAFIAATPERLLAVHDGRVDCDAIAGTRPGTESVADERMERHEHQPVVDAIERSLRPLCTELCQEQPMQNLSLQSLAHLHTPISGRLRPGVSVFQLLERLHPTPAVGGTPRSLALEWIRQHDLNERGWYTGAFGWIGDEDHAELSVLLRCALIDGDRARLYAGAGITEISDPQRELQETRLKFQPLLQALLGNAH